MSALGLIQDALETVYDLAPSPRVERFLVDRRGLALLGAAPKASEELFIVEQGGGMEVALWVDPACLAKLARLARDPPAGLLDGLLPAFTTAAEGVSHFVYVAACAAQERSVSQLELETQAEVDKFVLALLVLWRAGERGRGLELVHRLFERVGYRPNLTPDERDRYRTANRLARDYCRRLVADFSGPSRLEGLLAELRRTYRMAAAAKLERLGAAA